MAKEEQKQQERRVLKQGDGVATIGGLLAVGGAIAAAAFLGALCKHAAKRINGKSMGDSPRGEVSEVLNCKNREDESRGLRSLLQTSPPAVPNYQFQASHPRDEEESSGVNPSLSVADEFVISETLITEKEPTSRAKQEGPTPVTEEKFIPSSTSDKDTVFVGNDTGFGEDGGLAVFEEFSFPVVNPDKAGLDSTHVVYQEKEDLFGSSSLVLMPPSKGKEVEIGSQMISEEKDECQDGIEGIPMESEIEGGRDKGSTLARDDSLMILNIEQEKEEENYDGAEKFMVVEPTEAKASESYLVEPEKEEAYPGAGNIQGEPIKEEEPYHGAGDYQVERKDEKDKEEEALDEAGNYEKDEEKEEAAFDEAGKAQVEPTDEKDKEEEAFDEAGNYEKDEEKEEAAFDEAGKDRVEPNDEMDKEEEAFDEAGNYEKDEEKEEAAFDEAGKAQVKPTDEKDKEEEAFDEAGNYEKDEEKEEAAFDEAGKDQVEPNDEKDKEEEAFDEAGKYEKDEEKGAAAFDEAGKDQVEPNDEKDKKEEAGNYEKDEEKEEAGNCEKDEEKEEAAFDEAGNYEVEPEVERETEEEEAFDGAETYLVKPINEKEETGEAYYGPGDYVVETNVDEEKEEGSETTSTESNVEEEKDGEGSDGTGDSSMESNAEVIWPAEFIEGLLQSKTLGDVTNEKQSESANHEDGQYEEKETEDTQEEDDEGEEEDEDEDEEENEEEGEEEARDYLRKQAKENSSFGTEGKAMTGRGLYSVTTRGKSWGFLSLSAVVGFFLFLLLSHLLAENYNSSEYFASTVSASNR